jgi:hypothetical protein
VTQLRHELADATLDPASTVVVLDPQAPSVEDQGALQDFVEAGGHLIAGGIRPQWVEGIVEGLPAWSPDAEENVEGAADLEGVDEIRTAAQGTWTGAGAAVTTIGNPSRPLVVELEQGDGRALVLADASPLQNRLLAEADNAALGLALAEPGRPVVFVESQHGYSRGTGFGALPSRWKWFIVGLLLAVGVWMWSKARKLGPPEDAFRSLPPSRALYVEALAATLARTERRRRGPR